MPSSQDQSVNEEVGGRRKVWVLIWFAKVSSCVRRRRKKSRPAWSWEEEE